MADQKVSISREEYERLVAKAQHADAAANKQLSFKVAAKGGISVSGLNARFPVTLYGGQWVRLLSVRKAIVEFALANLDNIAYNEKQTRDDVEKGLRELAALDAK